MPEVAALEDETPVAKVLRFDLSGDGDAEKFKTLMEATRTGDIWESRKGWADVMLRDPSDMHLAARSGLRYATKVHDVEALVQESSQREESTELGAAHEDGNGDFSSKFHSAEEIHGRLKELAKKHPKRAKLFKMSSSTKGKSIPAITLGNQDKDEILILSGQHAREWIGPASLMHATEMMLAKAELGEAETMGLLDNFKVTIAPLMNPDGYTYSRSAGERMWRKNMDGEEEWRAKAKELGEAERERNCFGVDLNRNWMTGNTFKDQSSSNSRCGGTYEGARPFSEKETQGVKEYLGQIRLGETKGGGKGKVVGFVDLHSYGEDLILPGCDGRKMTSVARKRHDAGAKKIVDAMNAVHKQSYSYGSCGQKLGYGITTGVAGDWAHFDQKIPNSYSIEARSLKSPGRYHTASAGGYGFIAPAKDIKPVGDEVLAGIQALGKAIKEQEEEESF